MKGKWYINTGGSSGGNFWHQAGFLHSPLTHLPTTSYTVIKRHDYIHDCSFINNSSFVHADTRRPVQWRALAFQLLRLVLLLLLLATTLDSASTASGFDITGAKLQTCVRCLTLPCLDRFFSFRLPRPFHANDSRPAAEQSEFVSEYAWWVHRLHYTCMLTVSPWPSTGLNTD